MVTCVLIIHTYLLTDIVYYMEIKSETPNHTVCPNTWGLSSMHSFREISKSWSCSSLLQTASVHLTPMEPHISAFKQ